MSAILSYMQFVFLKIVNILNIKPFSDFPVSILHILLIGIIMKFIFQFVFAGFKETEANFNYFNNRFRVKQMSNLNRKIQIVKANKKEKNKDIDELLIDEINGKNL